MNPKRRLNFVMPKYWAAQLIQFFEKAIQTEEPQEQLKILLRVTLIQWEPGVPIQRLMLLA